MRVAPRGGNCSATDCLTNLNAACPMELKVIRDGEAVACKSTCQTEPCLSSQFFKSACSGARIYPNDNHGFFPCSSSHYTVTFCSTSKRSSPCCNTLFLLVSSTPMTETSAQHDSDLVYSNQRPNSIPFLQSLLQRSCWKDEDNKIKPSGKKVVKYTGALAVISVICGFIIFQIRLRLSNRGWELSLRAGTRAAETT
ncbi:hypothetical protein VNO80_09298 [Phaseolus coccineus]|uniref:Uncharacterized protein n=1 Tax=Phaseolus coccineus TaxID=3886 RepID=A0AAN9N5Y4_PHACN